jgi:hypothetical protein
MKVLIFEENEVVRSDLIEILAGFLGPSDFQILKDGRDLAGAALADVTPAMVVIGDGPRGAGDALTLYELDRAGVGIVVCEHSRYFADRLPRWGALTMPFTENTVRGTVQKVLAAR